MTKMKFPLIVIIVAFKVAESVDLSYTLGPLEGAEGFGVEVSGLNIKDVKAGQNDDLIKKIKDDLNEYSVIYLRNQESLTNKDLHHIASWWGEKNCNGRKEFEDRCVFLNTNGPHHGKFSDRGRLWHLDSSYREKIDNTIVYHIRDTPPEGPTLILPLSKCVEQLTPEEREKYENLWYITSNGIKKPLLVVHPATEKVMLRPHFFGIKSYIWNYGTEREVAVTDRVELNSITQELYKLLDERCKPLALPHTWTAGDVVLLDNMALLHRAGDEVPKDPPLEKPNGILLRVSAYSPVSRAPARGYVPRAHRPITNRTCGDTDTDCDTEGGQNTDKDEL